MMRAFLPRELPPGLEPLADLALDLRWTWSHGGDALWKKVAPDLWGATENPWVILQHMPRARLARLAEDAPFKAELQRLTEERLQYQSGTGWCGEAYTDVGLKTVAYFSMEYGLGEALPLYAGGLGVLAGDYLKAASDLGVPLVAVGLLYQEGYFRQTVDGAGRQQEVYPYNEPSSLPIQPVLTPSGDWLRVSLSLPGRTLLLRLWQANVGRVTLYLLDSNDPLNSPSDRGITGKLYGGGRELRLMQEIVLGFGGWRALEALGIEVDVCHINEGHAALVTLERARSYMKTNGLSFWEALWATRVGNVFTTHTPVAAGFDTFPPELIDKYFPYFRNYLAQVGISLPDLLALGRKDPADHTEPFNMAYLALHTCSSVNGVSRLHGTVSRRLFQDLYPRWPQHEIPVGHVTNGIHVPSWDSPWADTLWTCACGKDRWLGTVEALDKAIEGVTDQELWTFRAQELQDLIHYARTRLARQMGQRGAEPQVTEQARYALDPNALTLGFARRFAEYKRPNLLLHDRDRLIRLLSNPERPVQIIVAGKAHPQDEQGKRLVQEWVEFASQPAVRHHAVFLEDYDMTLAQELVQGVDVWINTPRRPWEACGTSGMKVLVNGGLNLSELDGWWAEAYAPELGWALGNGEEHTQPGWDAWEAEQLYRLLEERIVPAFYDRDGEGIPRAWVARMRASMSRLAPQFSSNRMVREYLDDFYRPAAQALRNRAAHGGTLAKELHTWQTSLAAHWSDVRFGNLDVHPEEDQWVFTVQIYLGEITADWVRVELYARADGGGEPVREAMQAVDVITGAVNGYVYRGAVPASRPPEDFTPRIIAHHPHAHVPIEAPFIAWQR